jgi:cation diffusion facilitator CzcD-associated flavoprotein CzcO
VNAAERVCVIGAGSSGIVCCQVLAARGIPFDCFEKGSVIGGNWKYENDNGVSSAYRSLHINTSRRVMAYATFPMPDDFPDYPGHELMARYFDDYADHFNLPEKITFNTEVKHVAPAAGGGWDVTLGDGTTRHYGAVMVANGHHWDPRWPEPPFPGEFSGKQMHAHHYRTPEDLQGESVLVLGIGNSACDIAVEAARYEKQTFLAMRRGAWVIPKYLRGTPTDEMNAPVLTRLPLSIQRFFFSMSIKAAQGKPTDYGLPEPDHKLLSAHPTVSSDLLPRIGHGDITVKPNIERLEGDSVRFVDGSVEKVDTIVYCTGYKISFPFLDESVLSAQDNHIPLYRRVVSAQNPGLYFIGLLQPIGPIMPLAELQAEWVADLQEGKASLPPRDSMDRLVAREDRRMAKRFVASKRHTIEVDFYPYIRALNRERRRGRRGGPLGRLLARRSHELRLGAAGS